MSKDKDPFKHAVDVAIAMIGNDPNVSEAEIDEKIGFLSGAPYYKGVDFTAVRRELLRIYNTTVGSFKIIEGTEKVQRWLKDFKISSGVEWKFWNRYKKYQENKHFSPKVIDQLDRLTDKILDSLFDPRRRNVEIRKKGLVVGQVQSGKTSNYTGLICKAADAGYDVIIVLAGILNNLRSQTQLRLDEGFLGFDTQIQRVYADGGANDFGVGEIVGMPSGIAHSVTTSAENGDFKKSSADSFGINFKTEEPILFVVKKNATILGNLIKWLKTKVQDGERRISYKSLLIIDDEADNASINTRKDDENPTAINRRIREVIQLFDRSAYVGYTATPFANLFISLDFEDDLFPSDFIINMPAPSNYIGPNKIFGTSSDPDDCEDLLPIVNTIDDYHSFIPDNHKLGDPKPAYESIPDSLKTAVKSFIVTCAIRLARGQGKKHNSMLIHVSRYQAWQHHIRDLVQDLFDYYKENIEAEDEDVLEEFRRILEVDSDGYKSFRTVSKEILASKLQDVDGEVKTHSWQEIKPLLVKAVTKIEIFEINGYSDDALKYYENSEYGLWAIVIGGDKLSRGLTLEGLSVSYFLRASKMYDTLMQMGRWFGYRPGYIDLCRLFTSSELNECFRHVTMASEQLYEEFDYMAESGGRPSNFALKVLKHPGRLQITSTSKMRNAAEIDVSFAGRLIETYQLSRRRRSHEENFKNTCDFIQSLGENFERRSSNTKFDGEGSNFLWKDVGASKIREFIKAFQVADGLKKANPEKIAEYIEKLNSKGELLTWRVALMSKKRNSKGVKFSELVTANWFDRTRADDVLDDDTYYIRKNHIIGSRLDEFIDLDKETLDKALARTRELDETWEKAYPRPAVVRQEFRNAKSPLLIIYPLNPECSNLKRSAKLQDGDAISYTQADNPFIGWAIEFPPTETNESVKYAVNSQYEQSEEDFDEDNDNDYDERD